MSGSKFAYDRSKRVLLKPGEPIFECNKTCACADGCPNRVVQQGRTVRVSYILFSFYHSLHLDETVYLIINREDPPSLKAVSRNPYMKGTCGANLKFQILL